MSNVVRFDCYEVDLASGRLCKRGVRIPLRDKSVALLTALLERPGELVTRDDLRHRLWRRRRFCRFRQQPEHRPGTFARGAERLCRAPPLHRDTPQARLPFHRCRYIPVPSTSADVAERRARLLVLPFVNLSGDPGEEYFSDAMTDEIITAIAAFSPEHLGVIARTTAMRYKGSRKDVERIGHELTVDYVVEGGVRRADDRVTINVQLIQVKDQTHLFARKYDAEMRDVFKVHDCIAQAIATHIPSLAADGARTHSRRGRARQEKSDSGYRSVQLLPSGPVQDVQRCRQRKIILRAGPGPRSPLRAGLRCDWLSTTSGQVSSV